MKAVPIKRVPTLFLKAVVVMLGALALALCAFLFPEIYQGLRGGLPEYRYVIYPGLIGVYLTVIPFLLALHQAFSLLRFIDANDAFSERSVRALQIIKRCAVTMSVLYAAALPLAYTIAELDDAPGLILISTAFACAPLVVATFAAVLQKLVRSAVDLKAENDLTV